MLRKNWNILVKQIRKDPPIEILVGFCLRTRFLFNKLGSSIPVLKPNVGPKKEYF